MRILLFFFIYSLISATLCSTVLSGFPFGRFYSVDLFILAAATIAFEDETAYQIPSLFIISVFRDTASYLPFGVSFLSFIIVLAVFNFLSRTISLYHGAARAVWTSVISLLDKIIIAIVFVIASKNILSEDIMTYSFTQAIGDGLLSFLMIPVLDKSLKLFAGNSIKHSSAIGLK